MQIKKKLTFYSSSIEDDAVKYVGHGGVVLSGSLLCCVGDREERLDSNL